MADELKKLLEEWLEQENIVPLPLRIRRRAVRILKAQAERIEELEATCNDLTDGAYRSDVQCPYALADKLKQENVTLHATAELVGTALRDYVLAQSRMSERWTGGDDAVKRQLWKDLHFCEALGREALEALKASATQPTSKLTDSDGSGT